MDSSAKSVETRSYLMVAHGETVRPDRCTRVWLGASDIQEERIWRDSETDEILNIESFWCPGQPNGVRIQNCAGIWELVSVRCLLIFINHFVLHRMAKEANVMMMVVVKKKGNVPYATLGFSHGQC